MRRGRGGAVIGLLLLLLAGGGLWTRAELAAPEPTRLLLDRHGRFLTQWGAADDGGNGYWPLDSIPPRVAAAIIAIEDRRFHSHPGVDPAAVARALRDRVTAGTRSGASTIAMQVARMQAPGPRNLARKSLEAATALALVARNGREAVLAHYLRLLPFGNGSHGIAHAARLYLDKPVEDLSWAEIAFLMAIPQSPARMNPYRDDGRALAVARGRRILAALARDGALAASDLALAEAQIAAIGVPERPTRPPEALHAALAFAGRAEALAGYRLTTTLDLDVQAAVAAKVRLLLAELRSQGAEHAAVIVAARDSREVVAYVGSGDYAAASGGAIDFARRQRSPGSTLKPFVYALALERGHIAPETVLADLAGRSWGIGNADRRYLGPMLPRQALANSRNVPAADLLRTVGVAETWFFLAQLGLHDARHAPGHFGAGIAVGALPTTLERLVTAYGALADDGRLAPLAWFRDGQRPPPVAVLSPETARHVTLFLADPLARLPSFPRMGTVEYPFPVAVKTGTSQGYRDAWTVAWSQRWLVGVWMGRADARPMHDLTGSRAAARLAREIMLGLHDEATPPAALAFPLPAGHVAAETCTRTGGRDTGLCDRTLTELYRPERRPDPDTAYRRVAIDRRDGLRAAAWTPARHIAERVYVDLGPTYVAWGAANGLLPPPARFSPLDRPLDRPHGAEVGPPEGQGPALAVVSPPDRMRLIRNPETPPEHDVLSLRSNAASGMVLWLVDGRPFALAPAGEAVVWPLRTGTWRFQAGRADGARLSPETTITVE